MFNIDDILVELEANTANEAGGIGSIVTGGKLLLTTNLKKAGAFLEKLADKVRGYGQRISLSLRNFFNDAIKSAGKEGIEVDEEDLSRVDSMMKKFSDFATKQSNSTNAYSTEMSSTIDNETGSALNDLIEDMQDNANDFSHLKDEANQSHTKSGKKKTKISFQFFRKLFNDAIQIFPKMAGEIKKLAKQHFVAVDKSGTWYTQVSTRVAQAISFIAALLGTCVSAAMNALTSILSFFTRIIMKARGMNTQDVSDQGFVFEPIVMA